MATSTIKSAVQVATFSQNYTLYANTARTVTVSPTDLGLSGKTIKVLMTTVTSEEPRYNSYFVNNKNYAAGTGVEIYMYSSTNRTVPITVSVLYEYD